MVISAYGYTRNEDMLLFDPILQEVGAQFRSESVCTRQWRCVRIKLGGYRRSENSGQANNVKVVRSR
jgi:hypothetical protein